ncbi:hypothetical protein [Prochlorothrix hollandica]|nr:hypothetical protein [Prochlorothrix hollandica]
MPALSRHNETIDQWGHPEPGSTDIHNRAGWHKTGATTGGLLLSVPQA